MLRNHQITIRETDDEDGTSYGPCEAIITNILGMKQVAAKFVPKWLNSQQKQHHNKLC